MGSSPTPTATLGVAATAPHLPCVQSPRQPCRQVYQSPLHHRIRIWARLSALHASPGTSHVYPVLLLQTSRAPPLFVPLSCAATMSSLPPILLCACPEQHDHTFLLQARGLAFCTTLNALACVHRLPFVAAEPGAPLCNVTKLWDCVPVRRRVGYIQGREGGAQIARRH